ncbi:hypothetical protein STEG23_021124 [Scotinomys teguina]
MRKTRCSSYRVCKWDTVKHSPRPLELHSTRALSSILLFPLTCYDLQDDSETNNEWGIFAESVLKSINGFKEYSYSNQHEE